jgi:hypothetical protein
LPLYDRYQAGQEFHKRVHSLQSIKGQGASEV